ncbi:hypothetical protein CDEST_07906 [Colletotrichum destructivum]|uniref:Uncharacterized protein n=1 Tax=Colletotrichum destructivum TaxID=34406 RepID=A0AAX4IHY1_9PEZI|nr:hypothetical protein CDEST_07906 [Colletotrichum destructivum]
MTQSEMEGGDQYLQSRFRGAGLLVFGQATKITAQRSSANTDVTGFV